MSDRQDYLDTLLSIARSRSSAGSGAWYIQGERMRQVEQEGWTPEHDDEHADGALVEAALCYVMRADRSPLANELPPSWWPWDESWWKPSDDPVRNLVKAGALIAAEIDRLQRSSETRADVQREVRAPETTLLGADSRVLKTRGSGTE